MATAFTPPRAPSVGLSKSVEPRIQSVPFGDGYSQDSPDGINTMLAKVPASWNSLSEADADTIEAFFEGLGGTGRFTYQIPGEASARTWKCTSWQRTWLRGVRYSFTAQWEEVVL